MRENTAFSLCHFLRESVWVNLRREVVYKGEESLPFGYKELLGAVHARLLHRVLDQNEDLKKFNIF